MAGCPDRSASSNVTTPALVVGGSCPPTAIELMAMFDAGSTISAPYPNAVDAIVSR